MAGDDQFSKHYERKQAEKKRAEGLVSEDDPPLPTDPVEPAKAAQTVGRNDDCPCGSGKKYKKCCGLAA